LVEKRYSISIEDESAEISTAAELVIALDVLQGHHDREVLEQLRPNLKEIIKSPQDLYATIRVLALDDKIYLIESLSSNLPNIVASAAHLRDILATLSEFQAEEKLLGTLGSEGLKALIHSAEDLGEVLEWVYGKGDQIVIQSLGIDYLKHLIQNGYELSLILHSLNHKAQESLIKLLEWDNVASLIKDRRDLAHLLRALPAKFSKKLLKHFTKEELWKIIRDEYGWQSLYKYLESEEATYLENLLGVKHAE
jgi:Mg/Co/Ni transporter MgtE